LIYFYKNLILERITKAKTEIEDKITLIIIVIISLVLCPLSFMREIIANINAGISKSIENIRAKIIIIIKGTRSDSKENTINKIAINKTGEIAIQKAILLKRDEFI